MNTDTALQAKGLVVRTSTGLVTDPDRLALIDLVDQLRVGEQLSLRTVEGGLNVLRPSPLHWQIEHRRAGALHWDAEVLLERCAVRQRVLAVTGATDDLRPSGTAGASLRCLPDLEPAPSSPGPAAPSHPARPGHLTSVALLPGSRSPEPVTSVEAARAAVPLALVLVPGPRLVEPAIVEQDLGAELVSSLALLAAALLPILLVILALA